MHIPVLLHEAIGGLKIQPGDVVLDGTINRGGHSSIICERLGGRGVIIGMDQDSDALLRAQETLSSCRSRIILINDNFRNLDKALAANGIEDVDKILLDIGLSSDQLEGSGRGFSFQKNEPLLMTFKANPGPSDVTAHDVVNTWDEENIESILYGFGEEKFAKRIARGIVERREEKSIETTNELAEIVKKNVPRWYANKKTHPATKTFQAIRMAVNDELPALQEGLTKGMERLKKGGRIAVISFHSLEDRIVKRFFKEKEEAGICTIITKKPVVPAREEILMNKRARSAKLRIAQKD